MELIKVSTNQKRIIREIKKVKGTDKFEYAIKICNQSLDIYSEWLYVPNSKMQLIFKILEN